MPNIRLTVVLCLLVVATSGCAVTEPDDRDTARVRAAVGDGEAVSISDLASDLGISEVAVVEAMPESMRVKLPVDDLAATFAAVCEVAPVELEFFGLPGAVATSTESRIVVVSLTADRIVLRAADGNPAVHLVPENVVYVYLVRRPRDGNPTQGRLIFFYDSGGAPVMVWSTTADSGSIRAFDQLWTRYEN
ncbi:hypothetical protein OT109_17560 [Phycisphaeraceae bacterium D3-23]